MTSIACTIVGRLSCEPKEWKQGERGVNFTLDVHNKRGVWMLGRLYEPDFTAKSGDRLSVYGRWADPPADHFIPEHIYKITEQL
jgi:hypothetical protein